MGALNKKAKDGGFVVTANLFDGFFKASFIDTQVGNKGAARKLIEMIYLSVDEDAVSITKNGKKLTAADVREIDLFKPEGATDLSIIGRLIEEVVVPSEDEIKK